MAGGENQDKCLKNKLMFRNERAEKENQRKETNQINRLLFLGTNKGKKENQGK